MKKLAVIAYSAATEYITSEKLSALSGIKLLALDLSLTRPTTLLSELGFLLMTLLSR